MSLRSPLARVRSLGSAKSGLHHWIAQRLTAVALLPLGFWFTWSAVGLVAMDYADAVAWVADPLNATLLIMFCAASFYHSVLGLQVVVEDYISSHWEKLASIIILRLFGAMLAIISVLCVLRVALGNFAVA